MPSESSISTVFSHLINAIMHLATTAPSGVPAAQAAAQAAHNEVQSWFPPAAIEPPAEPPAAEAAPGAQPDPANPATEADGDGPPAEPPPSNDLADEPSLDTPAPEHSPAG